VAGNMQNYAQFGYSGDGGAATAAQLYNPRAIAFGKNGDVFIADALNERIRKVDANGVISTFAGSGPVDSNGALQNGSTPTGNNMIRKLELTANPGTITIVAGTTQAKKYGGDGGRATDAQLNTPEGVAVDSAGNLFIADSDNNLVRKVDTNGTITTLAGDTAA